MHPQYINLTSKYRGMKRWKIILSCICILFGFIWYSRYSKEGFDITTFNVSYPTNELFLIAPNIKGRSNYVDIYLDPFSNTGNLVSSVYNQGYSTREEAQAACSELGATLATENQLKTATMLGAKWCAPGWVSNGNIYAPTQNFCKNTKVNTTAWSNTPFTLDTLRKFILPGKKPTKAFPICWGIKPPEPSVNIRDFNPDTYSMISPYLLNSVMNGTASELFPVRFSVEQAIYALEQKDYNIGAPSGSNPARDYLIQNMGSVNELIYRTNARYEEDGSNRTLSSCKILENTRTKFQQQFESLRTVFRDVSGAVISMLGAKNENAFFSAKLQGICSKETTKTSPACAKLATLDFDLLYGTQGSDPSTSRLAALEALNYFRFQREGELCTNYSNISIVESYLKCPVSGSIPECSYKTVSNMGSYVTMNNLDTNAEEYLKSRLKEISPYFATSDYKTLLGDILNQLSLTIRLPSLNDFKDSTANFKIVHDRIDSIRANFRMSQY